MANGQGVTVQETVDSHYVNSEGIIHAYPDNRESEYLSESLGLYLEYLLQVEDEKNFAKQAAILKDRFLIEIDGQVFIPWRLYEEANVNALIDDVRIASALKGAAEQFAEPGYIELSQQILSAIEDRQYQGGIAVDYYDWSYQLAGNRLTLSYLIDEMTVLPESFVMLGMEENKIFFPEYYDFDEKRYVKNDEVHMIDQLLIAVNRFDQGHQSSEFENWLVEEWINQGQVAGRYDRETGNPTVDYESLAVYYYLWQYFERIDQKEFAKQVVQRAESLAGEELPGDLHFFDFIHYQMMMDKQ
ncbi:hypothetical protein KQ939_05360 [Planococcus sp. CP5-4]|uniref:hypothetical protein n=1 Tax=unclassified Planococcus (in: firmicutes) TaxID=2662419 RepID=UPI001C224F8A|nr:MULTISPECIES: hypothetical protein [unclassified Planococcus (in: firmicutes)]MBU9673689.1 hypothetical protein [Planococcus sp. CP5-4_YE]MBV0907979.1 hypothetical protein [Planococcus sp. CP5-4_UN]MBW6063146.1 hypothetical protein [Planococcus sp. CP5-4]